MSSTLKVLIPTTIFDSLPPLTIYSIIDSFATIFEQCVLNNNYTMLTIHETLSFSDAPLENNKLSINYFSQILDYLDFFNLRDVKELGYHKDCLVVTLNKGD